MKRLLWILMAVLVLTACGAPQTATPAPVTATVTVEEDGAVSASAIVAPAAVSKLSFVIPAPVKEILVKEGDVVQAGQSLMTLDSPELQYGVAQAEAAYKAAEFDYQYWIPARLDRPPERRQLAKAELDIAQRRYETAQANATLANLSAPFAGTVISVDVQPGEFVQPGQVVLTLADLNALQIETTDLSERDILGVEVGQSANVFIEALNADLTGKVISISPLSEKVGGDVVYKVIIVLDEKPEGLLWGMNAEVKLTSNQ